MRRAAAALAAVLVLCGPAACFDPPPDTEVEVEDCDAEDRRNREAQCGYIGVRSNSDAHRDRPAKQKPVTRPKKN